MAIDYINNYPCKVKDTMPLNELIPLVKRRDHCRYILNNCLQNGDSEERALNRTIEFQVTRQDEVETVEMKLSDAFQYTKKLDELEVYCKDCPVSQGHDFGCYCVINYPLSGKAEHWLAEIARNIVKNGTVGSSILGFILDAKVDGGVITRMRAAGERYIELRKPVEVVVEKGLFRKKTVNTDQILNVLLDEDLLKYPKGALNFSGKLFEIDTVFDSTDSTTVTETEDKNAKSSYLVFNLLDNENDDHSIQDLKKFFRAVFVAYVNNCEVMIDR